MTRRIITVLGASLALFAAAAPSASAEFDASEFATPALPYCWGAVYGGNDVAVCAAEESVIGDGTIDPAARTECRIYIPVLRALLAVIDPAVGISSPCSLVGSVYTSVGKTGFTPSGEPISGPYTGPGLNVRLDGHNFGTLYVDDMQFGVATQDLCAGDCFVDLIIGGDLGDIIGTT